MQEEHQLELRIKTIESDITTLAHLVKIQVEDTRDVVEWVRNAKNSSRYVTKMIFTGTKIVILIAKISAAIAVIWGVTIAIRSGHAPDIHLP